MSSRASGCLVGWQTSEHRSASVENGRVEQGRRCPARHSATLTPGMHGGLSSTGKQVTWNHFCSCARLSARLQQLPAQPFQVACRHQLESKCQFSKPRQFAGKFRGRRFRRCQEKKSPAT